MKADFFSQQLLKWFDRHGRKHLPWQQDTTPYRVWVSEIMLQQTQVTTVIDYYQRFMARFPTIASLANADSDEVLHLWTGLGYYSRARNLHRTAQIINSDFRGEFPDTIELLCTLPGIGRSTAGAIIAIAHRQRAVILDGNVKRVLARFHAIGGWPGTSAVSEQLWEAAEQHTPKKRIADYTQAIMDLGATLCTRSSPDCPQCPVNQHCQALATQSQTAYPGKKTKKALPVKAASLLLIQNRHGEILLQKRPNTGIWGGLWSLPELDTTTTEQEFCQQQLGIKRLNSSSWPPLRHSFSHYHLDITPIHVTLTAEVKVAQEPGQWLWYDLHQPAAVGLAAPVKKLLNKLEPSST